MSTLKEKSLKQVKWVSFSTILPKLFAPITTILLANVFTPSEYGIVGICTVFIGFVSLLQGLGIDDYIIREKDLTFRLINTGFWANILISIICYVLIIIVSPIIAYYYKEDQFSYFLPAISISLIFNASGFVSRALLRKNLEFKKLFIINFAPLVISLSITLPLGYMKWGVWAIITGSIILSFLTNIYFIIQSKWRPKFNFDIKELKKMLKFGKFVIFERIQEFFYANIDVFFIGLLIDLKTLGIYVLAKSWSTIIFSIVTGPVTGILYPAFQNFNGNLAKISHYFLEAEKRLFFIAIPLVLVISGFSIKIISVIFPSRWEEAGLILSILIIGDGISKSFSLQRDLFKLIGRPDIYPKKILINFFFVLICFPFSARYGIFAFLFVKVLNDMLYTVLQFNLSMRVFGFTKLSFWNIVKANISSGCMMLISVLVFNFLFNIQILKLNILTLIIAIFFSFTIYILTYYFLNKRDLLIFVDEGKKILKI